MVYTCYKLAPNGVVWYSVVPTVLGPAMRYLVHTQPGKDRCGIYREVASSLCVEVQLTMKAYRLVLILLPVLIQAIQGLGELVLHIRIIQSNSGSV